jgi:hypothetical protein
MPINSAVTGEGRTSCSLGHPLGVSEDFDYKNLRTRIDIVHFIAKFTDHDVVQSSIPVPTRLERRKK